MHLKAVKLRGFKSFVDPVEVRLEPGVAVVVGPNGSGKSNISDSILWATGSLSPHELRAEKPDDVLFSGSAGRQAVDFCEVELVFDNEDGTWAELPFAEVSLARRLHRGGEGEYLINRAHVRRIDLVELLSDVGLGGGLRSIISQGSVETVLSAKPAERRALVEEAAGLGRFKIRRHRAELKLARVATQVDRARDIEAEVRKRLRPLALQATAAERAVKLADEVRKLQATIASLDLRAFAAGRSDAEQRRGDALSGRRELDAELERLLAQRTAAEEELTDAAGAREGTVATLYRLRSAAERIALRREAGESILAELEAWASTPPPRRRNDDELIRLARERLSALEHAIAEREGLPPAARALAEQGERLVLNLLDVPPGQERAVAAALGHRAAALLADDPSSALALVERARAAGLGSLVVLIGRSPGDLQLPVVPLDSLLASTVPAVTEEGIGFDPQRGELWFAGETAEAILLELEARRRALAAEVAELERRAANVVAPAPRDVSRHQAIARRLIECLTLDVTRFEGSLASGAEAARASELGAELRRLGAEEVELRRRASEAAERVSAIDVELARTDAERAEAQRRLDAAGVEPGDEADRDELSAKLDRLERRRELLGQVNPLAKEEYETEKVRLDELSVQRADLEQSLAELEQLRRELTETVERRFEETFAAVERHFAEVASTLFPGGEGRLRLTEDDEDGEPGIEVELRPAGKRVTRLSLLSGGEKALGAVAFLFSLFLARPSPFYLLDEVEAALDDANIGRFTGLLRRYAHEAQFIVITHQKRTMEAADVLYGVTMGKDGISQIVSKRLPHEEEAVAVA
ncbi:MAG TPA: AAA family ATPase [Gaiellaceae bacterium]